MEKQKEGVEAEKVEITTDQTAPTGEGNTGDNQEEEKVVLTKKEYETLKKKEEDFNKSIELKRLNKLANNESEKPTGDAEVADKVQKLTEEISSMKAQTFNSGLTEAYRTFVTENPWADDDAKFDKIKENFATVGTETREELVSKFKTAAQVAFPVEYEKHLEDKIKARVMTDKSSISEGGSATSATTIHKDESQKTEEDLRKERLGSLLRKNMTWIKN